MKKLLVIHPESGQSHGVDAENVTLEMLQREVGGYIQPCAPVELVELGYQMLCDEEGLLKGLKPNENLYPFFFVGNVVFVKVQGEEFVGLNMYDIGFIRGWLTGLKNVER